MKKILLNWLILPLVFMGIGAGFILLKSSSIYFDNQGNLTLIGQGVKASRNPTKAISQLFISNSKECE